MQCYMHSYVHCWMLLVHSFTLTYFISSTFIHLQAILCFHVHLSYSALALASSHC